MHLKQGDAVMHPARGAGRVLRVEERSWAGSTRRYYVIEMFDQPRSTVRVPVTRAEELGLRHTIPESQLDNMWEVLQSACESLPADHKERNQLLSDRLADGDALSTAEVVRDLAGWQQENGRLNTAGEQMLRKGIRFLAMEVAATRDIDLERAELQVRSYLQEDAPLPSSS